MNDTLAKVLTGISIALVLALAVPLGLMTAAIVRGESPRQLAEKAAVTAEAEETDAQPESSAKPLTVGEEFGVKPQVEPDPMLPSEAEAESEPPEDELETPEEAPESEPSPAQNAAAPSRRTRVKSANPDKAAAPVPAEPSQPESGSTPDETEDEADSLTEVFKGLPYSSYEQYERAVVQPEISADAQYAPPMFGKWDDYEPVGKRTASDATVGKSSASTDSAGKNRPMQ